MVRGWLFFLLLFPFLLLADQASIDASIDGSEAVEGHSIKGTIIIIHKQQESVDPASFTLENQPLKVSLVQEERMSSGSSDSLVSIYQFTLPVQPQKGLYVLPSISAKVGQQKIQSAPSSYEVRSQTPASPRLSSPKPKRPPRSPTRRSSQPRKSHSNSSVIFRLEAGIKGSSILYPGQRAKLFYRILYNRNIDLTESYLPFIHAIPFKKIGDAHITDTQENEITIQDISQEIEAHRTGTFRLGPSKIAGYAYQLDFLQQKVHQLPLLEAEAPAIEIEVKSFPKENRPSSFNGALGSLEISLNMLTPISRRIGDSIELELAVSGIDNLEDFRLPNLHCQPGFSGFFQFSDLPPSGEIKDNIKRFLIELIPISRFIQAVPSIELSSFDPHTEQYVLKKTTPLALQLISPPLAAPPIVTASPPASSPPSILWDPASWPLAPLEIERIEVPAQSLYPPWIQTPWAFLIIPAGIAVLLLQSRLKKKWDQHVPIIPKQSEVLLKQALKAKRIPPRQVIHLVEKAFWWRIWEKGFLPQAQTRLESLPKQGLIGEVRNFIFYLQSLQYSAQPAFSLAQVFQQAKDLFNKMS